MRFYQFFLEKHVALLRLGFPWLHLLRGIRVQHSNYLSVEIQHGSPTSWSDSCHTMRHYHHTVPTNHHCIWKMWQKMLLSHARLHTRSDKPSDLLQSTKMSATWRMSINSYSTGLTRTRKCNDQVDSFTKSRSSVEGTSLWTCLRHAIDLHAPWDHSWVFHDWKGCRRELLTTEQVWRPTPCPCLLWNSWTDDQHLHLH